MKKIFLAIVLLNLIGSLFACMGEIPATNPIEMASEEPYRPTLSPKPDWLVKWLTEPVCQPPCWEKIIPSKTSFADALAISNTISGANVSYVGDDNIRLKSNQYGAYNFALLLSRGEANIQVIGLTTRYTSLELSEIVDRYGFPDEMISSGSFDIQPENPSGSRWIDLLYYDLGMVIGFVPLPSDPWNKVSLSPDISIDTITFYVPQLEYYFDPSQWAGMVVSPSIKLNEYGDYDIPEGTCFC